MINLILFLVESKGEQNESSKENFKILICYMFKCNFTVWYKNDYVIFKY